MPRSDATAAPSARPLRLPEERLQALVEGLVGRRGARHAVLAVESMDGCARWQGAAGIADGKGTLMSLETPYFIASVDKLYTAAAILKLHERGQLDLDACLPDLLPPELTSRIHVKGGVDRSDQITVRHLLGHTSGLADYLEDRPRGGKSLVERLFAGEADAVPGVEAAMSLVREGLRPHFPPQDPSSPRSRARYCDTNYLLLIAILERVWGKRLHQVYSEAIFRPAGLAQTYVLGASEPLVPTQAPAALWSGGRVLELRRVLESLPSVFSTARDQVASLRALVTGEIFSEPATVETMQRPWKRFGFPCDAAALRAPSWPIEYGLGMMRFALPRVLTPLRAVPEVIGHSGSTGTWLFYSPRFEVLFAGAVNDVSAGPVPFRRVIPQVLRAVAEANRNRPAPDTSPTARAFPRKRVAVSPATRRRWSSSGLALPKTGGWTCSGSTWMRRGRTS